MYVGISNWNFRFLKILLKLGQKDTFLSSFRKIFFHETTNIPFNCRLDLHGM